MISSFTTSDESDPLNTWLMLTDADRAAAGEPSAGLLVAEMNRKNASKRKTFELRETGDTLLSDGQRRILKGFIDSARKSVASGCADIKITLGNSFGQGGAAAFGALLGSSETMAANTALYDQLMSLHPEEGNGRKIALRRTEGPVPGCIGLHTDGGYATHTVQIALNADSEYDGGRICFVTGDAGTLHVPRRRAGTLTSHNREVLHGVTKLHRGVRYSLFVVDRNNGLGERDVHSFSADAVAELRSRATPVVPPTSPAISNLTSLLNDPNFRGDPRTVPFDYLAACTLQWYAGRKIGNGVFGDVFMAMDPAPDRAFRYVVKKVNLTSLANVSETPAELGERMQLNEIAALTKFRNPFIVKLVGFTEPGERRICLAYEYCAGGALDQALLDDAKAAELTFNQRIRIALGVTKAISYLHQGGAGDRCFHRDVKSANICLAASHEPKLIDAGLARFIPEGDDRVAVTGTNDSVPGTDGYKCPRYAGRGEKFSAKSEVFSLGIVLLEIITGDVTITGKRKKNLYFHFVEDEDEDIADAFDPRAEMDGTWPAEVKTQLKALIESCLEKPAKRISMQAIMRQLSELERTHCVLTGSEEMLAGLRLSRDQAEASVQLQAAAVETTMKTCAVCYGYEFQAAVGIECGGGHFYCASCYEESMKAELESILASPVRLGDLRRTGEMVCPQDCTEGGRCEHTLSSYQISRCVSLAAWSKYESARSPDNAPPPSPPRMCSICLENNASVSCVPCGHVCGCHESNCLQGMRNTGRNTCPICNARITSLLRVFEA